MGLILWCAVKDLWPSTLAQHALASALGKGNEFGAIGFYHHPLMMDASGQKLSKSAGATSIKYLRESGKTPAEIWGLIAAYIARRSRQYSHIRQRSPGGAMQLFKR